MKESKTCPKCGSSDIKVFAAKNGESRGLRVGLTYYSTLRPTTHVCKACGYVEEYFTPEQLRKL